MFTQLSYTVATVVPAAYLLYNSFAAHLAFLVLIYLVAASNGAKCVQCLPAPTRAAPLNRRAATTSRCSPAGTWSA